MILNICLIDHDLDLVGELCDRIVVMAQGAVLAEGTMAEVRQHPQVQAAYLGNAPSSSTANPPLSNYASPEN